MRKLLYLFFVALVSGGCVRQEKESLIEPVTSTLIGKWELRQSFGGMIQGMTYAPGNGNFLIFDSISYQYISNGQVNRQGSYYVINDSILDVNNCELLPAVNGQPNRIIFDNEVQLRMNYVFAGRTVKITSGCTPLDGGGMVYYKIEGE